MVIMLSLLAFGVLFFQVGRAAIFSTEAQTAADAAALGAVQDVKAQLSAQVAATGTSSLALIDPGRVRPPPSSTRARTRGHVVKLERRGVDVKVWVDTNATLGGDAEQLGARGRARHRPRPGAHRRVRDRRRRRRRREHRLQRRRRDQADQEGRLGRPRDEISKPPTCGHDAKSNDLVTLGKLLREHGFAVAENAEMGDDPARRRARRERLPLQVPALRRRSTSTPTTGPAPRRSSSTGSSPTSRSSASARSGRRRGTSTTSTSTSPTPGRSGRRRRRRGGRRARGDRRSTSS